MTSAFDTPQDHCFAFRRPPELDGKSSPVSVMVVGAGIVGLTAALDLAHHGVGCILLDEDGTVSAGSRAMGYHRKTMEVWDRLGCAAPIAAEGVSWNRNTLLCGNTTVHESEMSRDSTSHFAPHVNLPQSSVERLLVEACEQQPGIDLRWHSRLLDLTQDENGVRLKVETPQGTYELQTAWLIAADGVRSTTRQLLGLPFAGDSFEEQFLIADVRISDRHADGRMFWFHPSFHNGQTALAHRQAGDIWRIDLQLGPDADRNTELEPPRLHARMAGVLGPDVKFEIVWASVYRFSARSVESMRHGRVFFAGDSAHQLSPFGGGRGANSGVQDVNNLAWKLALFLRGHAGAELLDTYDAERLPVARANVQASCRSAEFMAPSHAVSRSLRDAVLALAHTQPFARRWINSGRVEAAPPRYATAVPGEPAQAAIGTALDDALLSEHRWLLQGMRGEFVVVLFADAREDSDAATDMAFFLREFAAPAAIPMRCLVVGGLPQPHPDGVDHVADTHQRLRRHFEAQDGSALLIRPDQYVADRTARFSLTWLEQALAASLKQPVVLRQHEALS